MKKFLIITGICIATLLAVMLILPFALEGKISKMVKTEGNKMLNAQFDFEELNLSLFRHFPSATVSLEDFWLKGTGEFEHDTLAAAKEVSATVNLFSLFGKGGYEISEILLSEIRLHAIVSANETVNWDILKTVVNTDKDEDKDKEKSDQAPIETEPSNFRIQLENLKVEDMTLIYDDRKAELFAEVANLNAICSGDFASEQTLLKLTASTPAVTYKMNGTPLLNQAKMQVVMDVDADFEGKTFTFKDNSLTLNAITANLDGWVKKNDDGCEMDVGLYTSQMGLKELLSLVPGIYSKDFETLQADGDVAFTAFAKGKWKDKEVVPEFEVKLNILDGQFKYPSLPGGVDHIKIAMAVRNPGGSLDATTLDVHPFHFVMAGQPFDFSAQIKTPVSDLNFNMAAKGILDLEKIHHVCPVSEMELTGILNADMKVGGRLSSIQQERYEEIQADGKLSLSNMILKLKELPKMKIEQSLFSFSPKVLKLSETTIRLGENDVTFDSQFKNYLAFALQGKTLEGTLNVKSNHFNLNDFIIPAQDEEVVDTTEVIKTRTEGLRVPDNIDFRMQTDLKKVTLDKMVFKNISGLLIVKDQKVDMSNLSLQTMGGKVIANAAYDTPKDKQASINGSFALQELNFSQTYTELDMVRQLAPIFAGLKGTYSGDIAINAQLDEHLNTDLNSVQGKGSLSTHDLSLSGVKFIDQVANIVKKPELKDIKVQNLTLDFSIDNGRVTTQPFDLKLGEYTMNLSGSTGLDQTIDYRGKITLPYTANGKKRTGTVDMLIKGTFEHPEVSIDMASLAKNLIGQVFDNLTSTDEKAEGDSIQPKKKNIFDKALNLFNKKKE